MPDIRSDIRRAVEGVVPVSPDEIATVARRRRRNHRRAGAVAAAMVVAAVVSVTVALTGAHHLSNVTVGGTPGATPSATSSESSRGVTVRITFDTTAAVAGTLIHGDLEIVNSTGHPLVGKFCRGRDFGVQVISGPERSRDGTISTDYSPPAPFGPCHGSFSFPEGTSHWPLTVNTDYRTMSGQVGPLPAGRHAALFGFSPFTPVTPPDPAPITITLTSPPKR